MFQKQLCDDAVSSSNELMKLVKEVGNLCPSIELPWLECDSYLRTLKADRNQQEEHCNENETDDCKREELADKITERLQEPKDYSHLYIYKNEQTNSSKKPLDYMPLPSSSDEDNYSEDDYADAVVDTKKVTDVSPIEASKKKADKRMKRKQDYQPANVGLQQANVAKKRRKH